jgi:lipopolysaccharide/colanic/teichoic acid biosynthesis glycosyltransferase
VASPAVAPHSATFSAYQFGKRVVDVVVSGIVLILCLPLCLLVALAIRLESRGGVFFAQERAGRGGKPFNMLKFRSMVSDAEARRLRLIRENGTDGPVFKMHSDPRITRVGRVLRRTSLDELPQFLNVLLGEMSLVGPRPLPASDIGHHGPLPADVRKEMVEHWLATRQSVRPGITGLWQINGRSLLSLQGWIRYDTEYVDGQSALLDASILLLTPVAVLTGRGAV